MYDKTDRPETKTSHLDILHTIFIDKACTADYQMTRGILEILDNSGNEDDLVAFLFDKNLPVDDVEAHNIARRLLENPPKQGYLTISNALQWRLQYQRVIQQAGSVTGIRRVSGNR